MEHQIDFLSGSHTLRGILHLPESEVTNAKFPGVILCHGFTGNKIGQHRILVKAARCFCAAGFAVLRFDFSGCGDSDGEFKDITLAGQVAETLQALNFFSSHACIDQHQVYLLGLSMGGAVTALTAAQPQAKLAGLVMWAPVGQPYDNLKHIVGPEIFQGAQDRGRANFQGFELSQSFIQSLTRQNPLTALSNFAQPVLIIHGTADLLVPMEQAELYLRSRRNKPELATSLQYIFNADHTFSSPEWEKELFTKTLVWMQNL